MLFSEAPVVIIVLGLLIIGWLATVTWLDYKIQAKIADLFAKINEFRAQMRELDSMVNRVNNRSRCMQTRIRCMQTRIEEIEQQMHADTD